MIQPSQVFSNDPSLPDRLRNLAARSIPPGLGDDRFDHDWEGQLSRAGNSFLGATFGDLASANETAESNHLLGYLGGFIARDGINLDALVDASLPDPVQALSSLLHYLRPLLESHMAEEHTVTIWTKPSFPWHTEFADQAGLALARSLHQMRAPLPIGLEPLRSRAFVPGVDDQALRRLNNRAFSEHPDQGGQSPSDFETSLSQSWVDPKGIRLHEIDGQLVGFCWTKIHDAPALGEIYVIGIDPEFHGQGLGKPMTAAGLAWLHAQGLETAMLYVEADNAPAIATYESLGFQTVRTDRSWLWPLLAGAIPAQHQ